MPKPPWLLWLWAFRDLTREIPTVVMVDDHDMYQVNIWGWSGAPASGGDSTSAATPSRQTG